jgi:hypothetical protein
MNRIKAEIMNEKQISFIPPVRNLHFFDPVYPVHPCLIILLIEPLPSGQHISDGRPSVERNSSLHLQLSGALHDAQ